MKVLKILCFGLLFTLTQPCISNDDLLIVKGKILSEKLLQKAFDESCSKKNVICMWAPYHFSIKVGETLVGRAPAKLEAVEYLHDGRYYSGSEDYLFILERIEDDKKRELLNVDYYIKEVISRSLDYCFSKSINDYLETELHREAFSDKCYRDEHVFKQVKYRALVEIGDGLVEQLKNQGDLVSHDYLQVDQSGGIYRESKDEYPEDSCTDEDFDSFDIDRLRDCASVEGVTDAVEFKVIKGIGSKVIMGIEDELERLPFKNIKSEFVVESKDGVDIVRWFYEVL
ncbi:MAG: hypothetical protein HUJ16_04295 [Kangiella sp.]|nr:hypothetical protein [Kangiella sp.]